MELLFSPRGRIQRLTFWEGLATWLLLNAAVLVSIIMAMMYSVNFFIHQLDDGDLSICINFYTSLFFLEWVFAIWTLAAICAKRWHDLNFSGWLAAINTAPVVVAGLTLLAFFDGIPPVMAFKFITDPNAMGPGINAFTMLTKSKAMFYKDFVAVSPMVMVFSAVVLAGAFLFPGVLKSAFAGNARSKAAAKRG